MKLLINTLLILSFVSGLFACKTFGNTPGTTLISLTVTPINPTCQKANGKIIVQASGGIAPYTYEISGPFSPQPSGVFFNLPPGTYTLTVTDAIGTIVTQNVTLMNIFMQPVVMTSISGIPPTGCMTFDGSVQFSASGGTPPYLYSIDHINYQASNYFPGLTSGFYYLIVKDANGCTNNFVSATSLKQLYPQCPVTGSIAGFDVHCNPFEFSISLYNAVGNGTPPYMYSLDGINYQSNVNFYNLPEGLHTIWIKDAAGVILLTSTSLVYDCNPTFIINHSFQPALCGQNGSITLNPSEGSPPYQYSIDGINFQPGNQFLGLTPGSYVATVRDAYGLVNSKRIIVPDNCTIITTNILNSTCGNNNGKIEANASNGTAPYLYSLDGVNYTANNIFANLAAGNYTVYVKDASNNIKFINTIILTTVGPQINSVTATPTNCDDHSGSVTVFGSGGTSPFMYSIDGSNFQSSSSFTGLAHGDHTILLKDAVGCIKTTHSTVEINNNLSIDILNDTVVICEGTSAIINAISSATSFTWAPPTSLEGSTTLNPLAHPVISTKYFFTATSGVCSKQDSVYVAVKPAPVADAGMGSTICFGQNSTLYGSGGASYNWQPATYLSNANRISPDVINPQHDITYNLRVIGGNGCQSIQEALVTIKVLPPAKVFAGNDTSIAIGQSIILTATDVNIIGFNNYRWFPSFGLSDPNSQNPVVNPIKNETYILTAKTLSGCEGKDTINIKVFKQPEIYVPGAFTPNGDGKNDVLKAIPVGLKEFYQFTIFDRWGKPVFSTKDPNRGWDGKTGNGLNNAGSFIWIASGITYNSKLLERRGSVLLVR